MTPNNDFYTHMLNPSGQQFGWFGATGAKRIPEWWIILASGFLVVAVLYFLVKH